MNQVPNLVKPAKNQVWRHVKTGRLVRTLYIRANNVLVETLVTGRKTIMERERFERDFRFVRAERRQGVA